jgi:hypothetical protein
MTAVQNVSLVFDLVGVTNVPLDLGACGDRMYTCLHILCEDWELHGGWRYETLRYKWTKRKTSITYY